MSHVTAIKADITDLDALESACISLGATLVRNVSTYNWFGVSVGDTPPPEGYTTEDLGKCTHVIRLPGVNYEIGVVAKNGRFDLLFDFFSGWGKHDGGKLREKFGNNLCRLTQAYKTERVVRFAERHGKRVIRGTLPNGTVSLQLA
jgi:hypothetical protein